MCDPDRRTPLHLAVGLQMGDRIIFTELMLHEADTNLVDKQGNTPLHTLIKVIRKLDDAEAMALEVVAADRTNVNIVDGHDRSPLLLSVTYISLPLVNALLGRQADPNIRDKDQDLPLHASLRMAGIRVTSCLYLVVSMCGVGTVGEGGWGEKGERGAGEERKWIIISQWYYY